MTVRSILTVVTPAASYDLTTLAIVKTELKITGGDSDDWLKLQIKNASAAIANYCNRVFQSEKVSELLYVERDAFPYQVPGNVVALQLARWPIVAVTSVTVNGNALDPATDFKINDKVGQLYRLDFDAMPMLWEAWPVVVEYSGGFTDIPADVADACVLMVKKRWYARGRDPLVKVDEVAGVGRQEYWVSTGSEGAFPPDIADMIDNYRVPVTA